MYSDDVGTWRFWTIHSYFVDGEVVSIKFLSSHWLLLLASTSTIVYYVHGIAYVTGASQLYKL